jgi:hypothetical protein
MCVVGPATNTALVEYVQRALSSARTQADKKFVESQLKVTLEVRALCHTLSALVPDKS